LKIVKTIWDIVKRFEFRCKSKGWKINEKEDVISCCGEFNNILWIRKIRPSTFKSIATDKTTAIQKGKSYQSIDVSYNLWICPTPLSNSIKKTLDQKPELLERNAIYDLSKIRTAKTAEKLNITASPVCQEFESFLEDELNVGVKPINT
jgi:hypothetical protein